LSFLPRPPPPPTLFPYTTLFRSELNYRLRRTGGRILLDPSIRSWYFPRETPRALVRQYFNYGVCKASTLAKHSTLPTWRPLAPRSEEHTSELQSLAYLVCRLLLE